MIASEQLGSLIVRERKRLKLSQTDLALSINVTQSLISKYENGHIKDINLDFLNKLAAVFNCDVLIYFWPKV